MSRDRREEILTRLPLIVAGVDGIPKCFRNLNDINETDRPCGRLFDGEETPSDNVTPVERRGGGGHIYTMRPQLGIALSGTPETIGGALNARRVNVIKAITTDATLLGIVGRNGRIRYEGLTTELASGRAIEGEVFLQFAISYPLIPGEL